MAYALNTATVELAYAAGSTVASGVSVTFSVHEIGRLCVTTGAIAATDPFVNPDPSAFTRSVPPGEFPVTVAIARFEGGDERIAYARVEFGGRAPVRWEVAVTTGQDVAALGEDEFFGYSVDSGTGSFMDAAAGPLLDAQMRADDRHFMTLIEEMQKTYRDTRSWLVVRPDASREENLVCFSTGWGDGAYPTFFGLDADGSVAMVLTDFLLLGEDEAAGY